MRHALVDEAESDVSVGRSVWRSLAGNLGLLLLPFGAIGEQVVGVPSTHDAGAGKRRRNAGRSAIRDLLLAGLLFEG